MIQLGGNSTPFAILTLFNNFRDNLIIINVMGVLFRKITKYF